MQRLMMVFAFVFCTVPASSFANELAVQTGSQFTIVVRNRVTMLDGTHCYVRYNGHAEIVRAHRFHLTLRYLEATKYRGECRQGAVIRVGRTRFAGEDEKDLEAGVRVKFTPSERVHPVQGKTCVLVGGNTLEVLGVEGDRMRVRYHAKVRTNDLECADGEVMVTSRRRLTIVR